MNRPERGDITHRAFQFPHLPRDKSHVTHIPSASLRVNAECLPDTIYAYAIYAYAFQQIILSL